MEQASRIEVVPYNPGWTKIFAAEAVNIHIFKKIALRLMGTYYFMIGLRTHADDREAYATLK